MGTGAERILDLAAAAGVTTCFANPGTTELGLVQALETTPSIRAVLALFEGVCTGAADGYTRIQDVPALTLLHLGPGFANGMANLHNARRARSGIVNLVGDHPAAHLVHDSPLTSDILGMATTVSDWARVTSSRTLSSDTTEALAIAATGAVATLVVPMDVQSNAVHPSNAGPDAPPPPSTPDVDDAAAALSDPNAVLFLGGRALRRAALAFAHRIQHRTGCRVFTETFTARYDRGRGIPVFPPLPYFPEAGAAALADTTTLVTVGTREPVANFAFPGVPGRLTPDSTTRFDFATDDPQPVLEAIADRLDAPEVPVPDASLTDPAPSDTITARSLGALVAAHLAEGTVLVDEGATNSYGYTRSAAAAAQHVALGLTGGSIGIGLPLAVGAAVATGGPVVALQADGSAMYTNQSLWTMAREGLDVTVVILANERYAILQTEMHRAGADELGPVSRSLTELREPVIDFVALAASMGVRGTRCRTNGDAAHALAAASAEPGPHLLQVDLEPAGASA